MHSIPYYKELLPFTEDKSKLLNMFLMTRPLFPGMMLPPELQELWKNVAAQSGLDPENGLKGSFNGLGSVGTTPTSQAPPTWPNGLGSSFIPPGKSCPLH